MIACSALVISLTISSPAGQAEAAISNENFPLHPSSQGIKPGTSQQQASELVQVHQAAPYVKLDGNAAMDPAAPAAAASIAPQRILSPTAIPTAPLASSQNGQDDHPSTGQCQVLQNATSIRPADSRIPTPFTQAGVFHSPVKLRPAPEHRFLAPIPPTGPSQPGPGTFSAGLSSPGSGQEMPYSAGPVEVGSDDAQNSRGAIPTAASRAQAGNEPDSNNAQNRAEQAQLGSEAELPVRGRDITR